MSLFSWFSRKPAPPKAKPRSAGAEPSGLLNADATVPLAPGRPEQPLLQPVPPEHAANRKNERMERRELLYTVVRDAMVRAGVLSASYKFKVLSLDQRGRQFLVMMDLAREYGGETARLSEIEALIAQTAKTRYDILVTAVYWRINDHVAVGLPQKASPPRRCRLLSRHKASCASRCQRPSQQHPHRWPRQHRRCCFRPSPLPVSPPRPRRLAVRPRAPLRPPRCCPRPTPVLLLWRPPVPQRGLSRSRLTRWPPSSEHWPTLRAVRR